MNSIASIMNRYGPRATTHSHQAVSKTVENTANSTRCCAMFAPMKRPIFLLSQDVAPCNAPWTSHAQGALYQVVCASRAGQPGPANAIPPVTETRGS